MKKRGLDRFESTEAALVDIGTQEEFEAMGILHPDLVEAEGAENTNQPMVLDGSPNSTPIEHRRELIYILAANGMKAKQISEELGCSLAPIYAAMNMEGASRRVQYHQERLFGKSIRKRMDSLGNKAVDNLEKFLDSSDEAIQMKTSLYVLDQSVGKAKQTIQHEGSLISDLIDRVNEAREVKELNNTQAKPKDNLESFVDSFVPNHTVGVRNREKK